MANAANRAWQAINSELAQRWLVLVFFGVYLLAGLLLYDDFGASTDEVYQADKARLTLDYISGRNTDLLSYDDRHYGALFSVLLQAASAPFEDSRDGMLARHLVTFLFFYGGVVLFYQLARRLRHGRMLALAGSALLALHPQIFGHSFYNPKDIPFLTMYILALLSLAVFCQKPSWQNALLHGFASGLLVVFRLPGVTMWATTAALLLWLLLRKSLTLRQAIALGSLYLAAALASLVLFLPALWHNPLGELLTFFSMQPFGWTSQELLAGAFYPLEQIPWYHLPLYFGVTTPLPLLFTLGASWLLLALQAVRRRLAVPGVLALAALSVAVGVLAIAQPRVYNGWRHVFFVWPLMVLVMLEGLRWLAARAWQGWQRPALALALVALLGWLVWVNASLHPYQYAYYNLLAGQPNNAPRQNYIMDYWGLTYREAFEWIAANDSRPVIYVSAESVIPAAQNLAMLPAADRERIHLQEIHVGVKDDYYISNFKETLSLKRPNAKLLTTISRDNTVLAAIYRPR